MRLKKAFYTLLLAFVVASSIINTLPFKATAEPDLPVHNINTGRDYATIQEAINAPETLNGHTIMVDSGTYYEHVAVNKTLSLVGENKINTIVDGNGTGTVIYITTDNTNITGFTIKNKGGRGIYAFRSDSNNISHNILVNVNYAIWLSGSHRNLLTGNNISLNKYTGITVSDSNGITLSGNNVSKTDFGIALIGSSNNIINSNNVSSNSKDGIYFYSSNNNILMCNNIFSNNNSGIWLSQSTNNHLTGNNISLNNADGIYMSNSTNNFLTRNDVSLNNEDGICMSNSSNNEIFHNNFINNTRSLRNINSINSLDNGIEGNYWSNYNGTDDKQDGIGDTPHVIDENNRDNHPLMGPFTDFSITREEQTYHVYTICNSTIFNFSFNHTAYTIKFNVTGPDGTAGFCRIMIPEILITRPYITVIDDKKVNATILPVSNATHAFLYFTYNLSNHEVTISSKSYYELLEKYNKLLVEYQNLNLTLIQLLDDFEELNSTVYDLLEKHKDLFINYTHLLEKHKELVANYTELQHSLDSLEISNNTLFEQYNLLSGYYGQLNSNYNALLAFYDELESMYNKAINELANIKNQMNIFIATTIIGTVLVAILVSLVIKQYRMFNEQKKAIQAFKRKLEKISHLEEARARFEADVKRRRAKIEKFGKKYNVNIRPYDTLDDIIKSIEVRREVKEG